MPITRFSLSDLPDLADLQRATILCLARVVDFPFHLLLLPLSPGHGGPQPPALLLSRQCMDGMQAMRRVP